MDKVSLPDHFSSASPSPPFTTFPLRPLPEEILRMPEEETACQYCGISYLLLTKYERMENCVRELENQLDQYKSYAQERPTLITRIENLLESQRQSSQTTAAMQTHLRASQEEAREAVRALDDMKARNAKLADDMEVLVKTSSKRDDDKKRYVSNLVQTLIEIRSELIHHRQEVENVKADVRQRFTTFAKETLAATRSQLANHISSFVRRQIDAATRAAQARNAGEAETLRKKLGSVKAALKESIEYNDRLVQDLRVQRQEAMDHINSQKSYTQGIHADLVKMEERLHSANAHIVDISNERDRLINHRRDLEDRMNAQKEQLKRDLQIMQDRAEVAEEKVAARERELQEMTLKFRNERRSSEDGNTALGNLSRAMAAKDEQIRVLERSIRDMNTAMQGLRAERQKTIDAHQSRIKQLQDKFLEDIKEAGRIEADKRETEVRKIMDLDKEEALRMLRQALQLEFDDSRARMQRQLDALVVAKNHAELQAARDVGAVEEEWGRKYAVLNEQLKKLKASNAADFDHYQTRIRSLEEQLATASASASTVSPQQQQPDPAILTDLTARLAKRDAEIQFLKNTVRLECEERMELIAELANYKNGRIRSGSSEPGTGVGAGAGGGSAGAGGGRSTTSTSLPNLPRSSTSSTTPPLVPPRSGPPLDPQERAFEVMAQAANARKTHKLARNLSLRG
ncbi:hypothetical protein HK104_006535, partial [Borealophlyctis nickersoniae]